MNRLGYLILAIFFIDSNVLFTGHRGTSHRGTCLGQEIVAHRGASADAPENTVAAFKLAWQQQADAIEGDFYLSKDGHIVCLHDKTTRRVSPNSPALSVADSTLEELRKLDVGSWKHSRYAGERIPVLNEVLATIPKGKGILIEIKCGVEILEPLKKQLAASSLLPEQITIIAFSEAVVTQSRQMMPQYQANWLTSYKQKAGTRRWNPSVERVKKILERSRATGLGSQANPSVIDSAFVEAIGESGQELHVWTVNDSNLAVKFSSLGVASITTDKPAVIRRAIEGI